MKNITTFRPALFTPRFMQKSLLLGACLLLSLFTRTASAGLTFWDPQGTTGANPFTGSMTGTWENSSWSTVSGGQASPTTWVSGNAVVFAVHSGTATPAYTITMKNNQTVAGFFDDELDTAADGITTNVTITGAGILTLGPANLNGFACASGSYMTFNNVMAGSTTAGLDAQDTGQQFLNGANTYVGGTYLGYSGASWAGILNFNSTSSFGGSNIYIVNVTAGLTGALVAEGTAAITLTNDVIFDTTAAQNLNIVGVSAANGGVTMSGRLILTGGAAGAGSAGLISTSPLATYGTLNLSSGGGAGALVTISGVISGTNGFNKWNTGALALTNVNTYGKSGTLLGSTLAEQGWLVLGNSSGSATGASQVFATNLASVSVVTTTTGTSPNIITNYTTNYSYAAPFGTLTGNGKATNTVTVSGAYISATNWPTGNAGGVATLNTGPLTFGPATIISSIVATNHQGSTVNHAFQTNLAAMSAPRYTVGISSGSAADLLNVTGALTINATASVPLNLDLTSLTSTGAQGAMASPSAFDNTQSYSWKIIATTTGITGFNPANIAINTAGTTGGFANSLGSGIFTVTTNNDASGHNVYLNFGTPPALSSCQGNISDTSAAGSCGQTESFSSSFTGSPVPTMTYTIPGPTTITSPYFFPVGTTTVTATAVNGFGSPATCSFTVTISDVSPPTAGPFSLGAVDTMTATVSVAKMLILAGQSPSGCPLFIVSSPQPTAAHGTVVVSGAVGSQTLAYTPTGNYVGPDTINYTLSDGGGTAAGTIDVTVAANGPGSNGITITGTPTSANLLFYGIPGQAYYIQTSSPGLTGPWTDLPGTPIVADSLGMINYTVTNPPSPSFYRTSVNP
jgi:hypothetical protein